MHLATRLDRYLLNLSLETNGIQIPRFHRTPELIFRALLTENGAERVDWRGPKDCLCAPDLAHRCAGSVNLGFAGVFQVQLAQTNRFDTDVLSLCTALSRIDAFLEVGTAKGMSS
jgi:hypothetical protein